MSRLVSLTAVLQQAGLLYGTGRKYEVFLVALGKTWHAFPFFAESTTRLELVISEGGVNVCVASKRMSFGVHGRKKDFFSRKRIRSAAQDRNALHLKIVCI